MLATLAQDEAIELVRSVAMAYLGGTLGINAHVPGTQDRNKMEWALVCCLGVTQLVRQIIRP